MATYLPGVTDTGFNPVQYTPNFSLLANALDKATARYETNFQKLSQGYQSILNASITNDVVSKKRDEYLNNIKDQLKTLSSTDLSIQANVNTAENLYSPFWEDKTMLAHIADTKERQAQMQEQLRIAKEHPDYDNSTVQTVMNYYTNKIKTSQDPNIINSVPTIKATSMPNRVKEFNEWLKTNNYEVTTPVTINGRLYTQTNGDGTQHTYSNLFNQFLGNAGQEQYQMYGQYYKIQAVQDIKATERLKTGLDISDDEAEKKIPMYYESQAIKNLDQNLTDYNTEIGTIIKNGELAARNNDLDKLELLAKRRKEIDTLIDETKNGIESIKTKKTINGVDYQTTMDNLFKNPVGFFAQSALQKDALSAGVMAANKQSLKIEKDDAYWEDRKLQQNSDQFNQELTYKYAALDVSLAGKSKKSLSSGKVNEQGQAIPYENITPQVEAAPSNNDIQSALVRKQNEIKDLSDTGKNLLVNTLKTSTSPYLASVASSAEISILSEALYTNPKEIKGPKADEYNKTFNAVKERLKTNNIDVSKVTGPVNLFSAISQFYEGKILSDLDAKENHKKDNVVDPALNASIANELDSTYKNLKDARTMLDKAYASNIEFERAISSKLKDDRYKDIRVQKKDGTFELITAKSLADAFPLVDPRTKKVIGKIPENILQEYMNGTLTLKHDVPENYYNVWATPDEDTPYIVNDSKGNPINLTSIVKKFGTPTEIKKTLDRQYQALTQNVDVNQLKRYQDETGQMGKAIIYKSPNEKGEDLADAIAFDVFTNPTKVTQQEDKVVVIGANDDLNKAINEILLPAITGSPYKGLTSVSLYNIGAVDPTKRNIKFKYDLSSLGLPDDDKKALKNAGYTGEFTLELQNDAAVKGFPQKYTSAYDLLLSDNVNKPVNQTPVEERSGLKYSFYKDQNNVIWCKGGYEVVDVVKDPRTLKNVVQYRWIDANPSRKGQDYIDANNGYTELPQGQTIDDYLESLKFGLGDQFRQNSIILQKNLPNVNSQTPYAVSERIKELQKTINGNK
jgi:hypothetical protein